MKGRVVEMTKESVRLIIVKVVLEDNVLNIVSTCIHTSRIWGKEGHMNGYMGKNRIDFNRIYCGHRFKERNEAGEIILDLASAWFVDTFWGEREEHLYNV